MTGVKGGGLAQLGVVTVTYNSATFLDAFFRCLQRQQDVDFELLVIDNSSTDRTWELLTQHGREHVTIVRNGSNIGYAAACNQAVAYFRAKGVSKVLFINNDTEFGPGLFSSLLDAQSKFRAAAVTPRITYYTDQNLNWYAGGRFVYWKGFQGQHDGEGKPQSKSDTTPRWVEFASGCCLLFDGSVFDRIGDFDETYFVYWEDTDLCLRMRKAGLPLLYVPSITIAHKISLSTGGPLSEFSIRYYQRNQIYCLRKNFGPALVGTQLVLISIKAILRWLLRKDNTRQAVLRLSAVLEGIRLKLRNCP